MAVIYMSLVSWLVTNHGKRRRTITFERARSQVIANITADSRIAPWRATLKPNTPFAFTPRQVQLALPTFLVVVGSPAHPTGPAGKAPGRALGFKPEPRPHLKPICKSPIPKKPRPAQRV